MKSLFATLFAAVIAFTGTAMFAADAEAKRLGGGGSFGMKRSVTPPPAQNAAKPATPAQNATPASPAAQPAAAQPSGARKWLGPIAGLAAGLGIAALLSHFGLGEGVATFLMVALLVLAAVVAFKLLFRKREPANAMQYAGAGASFPNAAADRLEPAPSSAAAAEVGAGATAASGNIPADFDVDGFLRQAKLNYIRLQAANDRGDMDDIRNFTTPEMFAEIQMQYEERGRSTQETDVQQLDAAVLDVAEEPGRYVVSVRFFGRIREEAGGPVENFDEVWHLTKPVSGGGWVIAGIQQLQ